MRNGSHRFWLCIAAAVAVSAIAIPAASAGVHKYDTRLGITDEGGCCLYHGGVKSDRDRDPAYHPANAVRKCMEGRRVILFEQRPGADRMLGTARSHFKPRLGEGYWQHNLRRYPRAVYAKVTRKVGKRFVCRADRSGIKRVHRGLAVATAAAIPALGASIGKGSGGPGVESGIRIAAGSPHFHGHIMANQNKDCIRHRKVRLYKTRQGPNKLLGKDKSNHDGKWKIKVNPLKSGRYYAEALRSKDDHGLICRTATSPKVRID